MKKFILHVKLISHEEYTATIVDDLPALIESIQSAEGCISANLYRAVDEPHTFYFVQTWIDESHWAKHTQGDFVKAFSTKFKGNFKESIMTHVDEVR